MRKGLTARERRRKAQEGSSKLQLWLVSWVYNSQGKTPEQIESMRKTQIAKWKDLCYHTNKREMVLDPMAFERASRDSKIINNIKRDLGLRKTTLIDKIKSKFRLWFFLIDKKLKQAA